MIENLTVVVPFWNGQATLPRLLASLPAGLPVIVVDDHSDKPPQTKRPGVRVIRPPQKGFFAGAVNAGLAACGTDVLVLNQDVWLEGEQWLAAVAKMRRTYAVFGDGVEAHPAWPRGYVHGTFMFMRRDAIAAVGGLNERDYPLWGCTCEWQLRACRAGFRAHVSRKLWRQWFGHEGRHDVGSRVNPGPTRGSRVKGGRRARYGSSIREAIGRWPGQRARFLAVPPAVSVIVPCFNYGRYLPDCIASLVGGDTSLGRWEPPGQTFQSFEVIIVDDASTDDSWQVAQALADPWKGVHAIRLPRNRGTPGAINAGIERARGEYIHILSADDMREPWGLEVLYRACQEHPGMVAYGNVRIFGDGQRGRMLTLPGYDFDLVLHKNPMPAGIMYPRAAWEAVGGYPEVMKLGREDWAFNIRLGAAGYCGHHVGDSGNLYRREGQNRSLRTGNVHRREAAGGPGAVARGTFKAQLKKLYPRLYAGWRPPMCCGRQNTPKATPRARALPGAALEPVLGSRRQPEIGTPAPGMEWLEYVGGNAGNSRWIGPATGTRYIFGGGRPVGQVYAEDARGLLDLRHNTRAVFRRYKLPAPVAPAAPAPAVAAAAPRGKPTAPRIAGTPNPAEREPELVDVAAPEPEPRAGPVPADDLTRIAGVGPATAARLDAAGFGAFATLAGASPETVARLAGIPRATAERAVAGAAAVLSGEGDG
jgi:glycosyltransferase involved in cell wall biosynthesis/predicted flap endonuclease-1-like 5' DNA nuclease